MALLNNVLAAVNLEGNRFFYVNPLEADGKHPFNHGTAGRAPWFGTACCPSNMARLLPQIPGMTYAHDDRDVFITFYAESRTEITLDNVQVELQQQTAYPNDGEVSLVVNPAKQKRFRVLLRIPTWARKQFVPGALYRYVDTANEAVSLTVNGEDASLQLEKGFVAIERQWKAGDRVQLKLPMPVHITECHPAVKANRNRIALTRGPFVLCAEGVDNGGATQRFFFATPPEVTDAEVTTKTIDAGAFLQVKIDAQSLTSDGSIERSPLLLTPYYAWNNRGVSSMTVWFPRDPKLAVFDPHLLPKESVFSKVTASHTFADDTVNAVGDGKEPRWSSGKDVPRWTSRPQKNKPQWVEARFDTTKSLRSVGVYWMQDRFDVKFPAEWSLEVEQNGKWMPFQLYTTDRYDTRANRYNVVHPAAPTRCDAIRVRMTPKKDACVGILEIIAEFEEE
nr:beta-L-arabinofuranosidase domain-containing protein [Rhodopirellula sp. SM50]